MSIVFRTRPIPSHCDVAARKAYRARQDFLVVAEIVIECVHPGNLGHLPPSPVVISLKARQIGLID